MTLPLVMRPNNEIRRRGGVGIHGERAYRGNDERGGEMRWPLNNNATADRHDNVL